MVPGLACVGRDAPLRGEAVLNDQGRGEDAVIVAVPSCILERPQRSRKRVLLRDVACVADIGLDEIVDRPQLAHVVSGLATFGDEQADLAHNRVVDPCFPRKNEPLQDLDAFAQICTDMMGSQNGIG